MKVRIDKSVFDNATNAGRQLELEFLLHIILYKRRYELILTDVEILRSRAYPLLSQTERMIVDAQIANSINASVSDTDCNVVVGGDKEEAQKVFSPAEAVLYLLQPLSVILENVLNDAHFMNAVFRHFDSTGKLVKCVSESWLRFENAGGCSNVKNFLQSRVAYYGGKQKFLRCYVLIDGDRRFPNDPDPEKRIKKLKEQLAVWEVDCHVLEKRCMENYLPDDAMRTFMTEDTKEWINAYNSLTPQQKDCFCIAEGFRKDITKENKSEVKKRENLLQTKDVKRRKVSYVRKFLPFDEQAFYSNVSRGNFLHLEKGLKMKDFKVKYPEAFDDDVKVYKANMLQRTCHQSDPLELEHIADGVKLLL